MYSASASSCGINKALLPVAHPLSLSVGWLASCTPDYVGACLLPKLKRCDQRQAVMPTRSRQCVVSGSFGDSNIGRRQGKKKSQQIINCAHTRPRFCLKFRLRIPCVRTDGHVTDATVRFQVSCGESSVGLLERQNELTQYYFSLPRAISPVQHGSRYDFCSCVSLPLSFKASRHNASKEKANSVFTDFRTVSIK